MYTLAQLICWLCRHDDSGLAAYLDPKDHQNNSAAMLLQCLQSGAVSPRDTAAAETAEALAGIFRQVGAGSQAAFHLFMRQCVLLDCCAGRFLQTCGPDCVPATARGAARLQRCCDAPVCGSTVLACRVASGACAGLCALRPPVRHCLTSDRSGCLYCVLCCLAAEGRTSHLRSAFTTGSPASA